MAFSTAQLEIMRSIDRLRDELVILRREAAAQPNSTVEALLSGLQARMPDCLPLEERQATGLLAEVKERQEALLAAWTGGATQSLWSWVMEILMLLLGSRSSLIAVVLIVHGWRLRSLRQRWAIWIVAALVDPPTTGVWLAWKLFRGVRGCLAWVWMKIGLSLRKCCCCSPRQPTGPAVPEQPAPPAVAEGWGRRALNFLFGDPNAADEQAARACAGCVKHCPGPSTALYRWLWATVASRGPEGGAANGVAPV